MEKNYSLTDAKMMINGHIVYKIKAERDFMATGFNGKLMLVVKGTEGGWVEKESNLAQDGSWLIDSVAYGNARLENKTSLFQSIAGGNVFSSHSVIKKSKVMDDVRLIDADIYKTELSDTVEINDAKVTNMKIDGDEFIKTYGNGELKEKIKSQAELEDYKAGMLREQRVEVSDKIALGLAIEDGKLVSYFSMQDGGSFKADIQDNITIENINAKEIERSGAKKRIHELAREIVAYEMGLRPLDTEMFVFVHESAVEKIQAENRKQLLKSRISENMLSYDGLKMAFMVKDASLYRMGKMHVQIPVELGKYIKIEKDASDKNNKGGILVLDNGEKYEGVINARQDEKFINVYFSKKGETRGEEYILPAQIDTMGKINAWRRQKKEQLNNRKPADLSCQETKTITNSLKR